MHSTREFDAFGPWIDEVHTVDDLPRLYRDAGLDPRAYRLVLKVPRDVERREANPDMHLYDHLLAVDEETFTVLSRRGDSYTSLRVPFDRMVAVEDSTRLLDGRLTVHTTDGPPVVVPYNGSAGGPVRNLVRVLRQWYAPEAEPVVLDPGSVEVYLGPQDTGLVNFYRRMTAQRPAMHLVNVAHRQTVVPIAALERAYRMVWPMTLHASIVVADDREIEIFHRRDWFTTRTDDLSLAHTVLPRARVDTVSIGPHERYRDVHVLVVRAGTAVFRFPLAVGPLTTAVLGGDSVTL